MDILISGSRLIGKNGLEFAAYLVQQVAARGARIIVGDAPGVDQVVIKAAAKANVPCAIVGAHGKVRNRSKSAKVHLTKLSYSQRDKYMIGKADEVWCIWNGQSSGTAQVFSIAKQWGKRCVLLQFNEDTRGRKDPHKPEVLK